MVYTPFYRIVCLCMPRLHYICAKIIIIEPKLYCERAKITKLKKSNKKIAKKFGGFK